MKRIGFKDEAACIVFDCFLGGGGYKGSPFVCCEPCFFLYMPQSFYHSPSLRVCVERQHCIDSPLLLLLLYLNSAEHLRSPCSRAQLFNWHIDEAEIG
jgi:hypothetical protein